MKSDINSVKGVQEISKVLNCHPFIQKWTVDLDDIDKVLRIELSCELSEKDIQRLIMPLGYHCEDLPE